MLGLAMGSLLFFLPCQTFADHWKLKPDSPSHRHLVAENIVLLNMLFNKWFGCYKWHTSNWFYCPSTIRVLYNNTGLPITYVILCIINKIITYVTSKAMLSKGGIPATYFAVYFNITICHLTNYTTLNGHIIVVNWREPPLLMRIKVKF